MNKAMAALLVALVCAMSVSKAQAYSLQDLFNGETITVGSIRLYDWAPLNSYGNVDPASVHVEADNTDPNKPGIVYSTFDGSPILYAEDVEGSYQNSYFFFSFSVLVLAPHDSIGTDTFTIVSGDVIADDPLDSDSILITENVADSSYNFLAEKQMLCASPDFTPGTLDCSGMFDIVEFTPHSIINITTYFQVDGRASLYTFSQHFTPGSPSTPFNNHGDCVNACVQDRGVLFNKGCSDLCKTGQYEGVPGATP